MKFITSTTSSNSDYNAEFDYAFIEIDKEVAARVMARHEIFTMVRGMDHSLFESYFWDSTPEWFSYADDHDKELPDQGEVVVADEKFSLDGFEMQNDECCQMIICEEGVRWTTIPKHTGIYITSETIPIEKVRECL